MKVNCFQIGAQKAGTTTLYSWLQQHPKIDAPERVKDLHFFNSAERQKKGIAWYEAFYNKRNATVRIDASVNYLFHPETAKTIAAYNPNAKIILVLRDPAKRVFSAYQFFSKLNLEKKEFEDAVDHELQGRLITQQEKDDFAYIEHGYYFQQLQNWLKYFDRKQIMILFYEELFKNPEHHLPQLFDFLDVANDFVPERKVKNRTGAVKYKWLNGLVYDRNSSVRKFVVHQLGIKKLVPTSWRVLLLKNVRDLNTKKSSEKTLLTEDQYNRLSSLFKKDVQNLSSFLNKDLSGIWKY